VKPQYKPHAIYTESVTSLWKLLYNLKQQMSNKSPEIEFINLDQLAQQKQQCQGHPSLESLKKLANGALKKGPFSVTFNKEKPHIAASGDPRDFLSYAP
jgi:hypothetical protein